MSHLGRDRCGCCVKPTPYCMVGFVDAKKPYSYNDPLPGANYGHNSTLGLIPCVHGAAFADIGSDITLGDVIEWDGSDGQAFIFSCFTEPSSLDNWDSQTDDDYTRGPTLPNELNNMTRDNAYTSVREVFDGGQIYWVAGRKVQSGAVLGWMQISSLTDETTFTYIINPTMRGATTSGAVVFNSADTNRTWYGGGADNLIKRSAGWEVGPHAAIVWNNWTGELEDEGIGAGRLRYALLPTGFSGGQVFVPVEDTHHVQTDSATSYNAGRIVFLMPVPRMAPLCVGAKLTAVGEFFDIDIYLIDWRDPTTYWAETDGGGAGSGFAVYSGVDYVAKGWRTDNSEIVGGAPLFTIESADYADLTAGIVRDVHIRNGRTVVLLYNGYYWDSLDDALHACEDTGVYQPDAIHIGTDGEIILASDRRVRKVGEWAIDADYIAGPTVEEPCGYRRRIGLKITSNRGGYCVRGFSSGVGVATEFTQDVATVIAAADGRTAAHIGTQAAYVATEWWDHPSADHPFFDYGYEDPFPSNLSAEDLIDEANTYGVLNPFEGCTFTETCICPNIDYGNPVAVAALHDRPWTVARARFIYSAETLDSAETKMTPYDYWIFNKAGTSANPCRKASKLLITNKALADAEFYEAYSAVELHSIQAGLNGSSIPMPLYEPLDMTCDMSEIVSCPTAGF